MDKLYLIYPLRNSMPNVYTEKSSAVDEAKRLARLNPGETFWVMGAVAHVTIATPVEIVTLDPNEE